MTTTTANPLANVFGVKPPDSIFYPQTPFAVRFNCQVGQLALDERTYLGSEADISILKISRFFGNLGRTKMTEWLQIFYVAAPGNSSNLPANTVCVSYLKTRSLSVFNQQVIRLVGDGLNPAVGIFKASFNQHQSGERNYYSVAMDWRERQPSEQAQLGKISEFLGSEPSLMDLQATRDMISIDSLSQDTVARLVGTAKTVPDETPVADVLRMATAPAAPPAPPAAPPAPPAAQTPVVNNTPVGF